MLLLPLLTTLLLTLVNVAAAQAVPWTPPLAHAAVARDFDFDARTPFVRGLHRGVRLTATPGSPVRAACGGRVTFAGRHPSLGPGLALRCGALVATEFGLERPLVRRGELIAAGTVVGRLGGTGRLHLGARSAALRFGYRDPLGLLGRSAGVPVAPAARGVRRPRAVAHHPVGMGEIARTVERQLGAGAAQRGVDPGRAQQGLG